MAVSSQVRALFKRSPLVVLVLLGIWLLVCCGSLGRSLADSYVNDRGGKMDTGWFTPVYQGYVDGIRWLGAILLGVGLLRLTQPRQGSS
jgi:hypothetical protein